MTWSMLRLDLARPTGHTEGSAAHACLLRLPRDEHGIVDLPLNRDAPEMCTVPRSWSGERDVDSYLRHGRKGWAETHPQRYGEYATISEPDGAPLRFRVSHNASCDV